MKKSAILLGATGLTGGELLDLLLSDDDYAKVTVLTRRPTGKVHPKLEEHIIDLLSLEKAEDLFSGDVVFCCIGTTRAKTPDKELYQKIDYGIPVTAAAMAQEKGIPVFIGVSSLGADPESRFFYNRTKGEMERDVAGRKIRQTYFLRPSLITGPRGEKRLWENSAEKLMRLFDFLIPVRYKMISASVIAEAMIQIAKRGHPASVIPSEKIREIAKG